MMQKAFYQTTQTVTCSIGLFILLLSLSYYTSSSYNIAYGQKAIQISAKLVGGDFKWVDTANGESNPTLMLKANTDQIIKIQNPTDTKHQFIIDQNGKQLATSGDVAPGSSGQVYFKPITAGTYRYHCLYHPTMMKGVIQVS
jgi:heme/copper-type cytochrome/quinol oxidase subunit 2